MLALLIENSKLVMMFLLIGTIIGLAYFGGGHTGMERATSGTFKKSNYKKGPAEAGPSYAFVRFF